MPTVSVSRFSEGKKPFCDSHSSQQTQGRAERKECRGRELPPKLTQRATAEHADSQRPKPQRHRQATQRLRRVQEEDRWPQRRDAELAERDEEERRQQPSQVSRRSAHRGQTGGEG